MNTEAVLGAFSTEKAAHVVWCDFKSTLVRGKLTWSSEVFKSSLLGGGEDVVEGVVQGLLFILVHKPL